MLKALNIDAWSKFMENAAKPALWMVLFGCWKIKAVAVASVKREKYGCRFTTPDRPKRLAMTSSAYSQNVSRFWYCACWNGRRNKLLEVIRLA